MICARVCGAYAQGDSGEGRNLGDGSNVCVCVCARVCVYVCLCETTMDVGHSSYFKSDLPSCWHYL